MYRGTVPAVVRVETGGRVAELQATLQARLDPAIDFATCSRALRGTSPRQPQAYHAILALTFIFWVHGPSQHQLFCLQGTPTRTPSSAHDYTFNTLLRSYSWAVSSPRRNVPGRL